MNSGQTVFSQLISFLPDREFRRCAARYGGDRRLRGSVPGEVSLPGLSQSAGASDRGGCDGRLDVFGEQYVCLRRLFTSTSGDYRRGVGNAAGSSRRSDD